MNKTTDDIAEKEKTPAPPKRGGIWRVAAIVAAVLLLVSLSFLPPVKALLEKASAWTIQFVQEYPVRGAVIFVLFSTLSAMLAFASTAVLVPPATLVWGKGGAFLLLWSGWTLGAAAAYGIGRSATPLLIRLGYGKKLERYQQFVSQRMGFKAVLLFCLAIPSEVPGYLFGGAHYKFGKFILAMGIAEAVYAAILVIAGESLLSMKPGLVLVTTLLLIIGVVIFMRLRKKVKTQTGER